MVICPSCGEQNYLSGDRCWACGKSMLEAAPEAVPPIAAPPPEPAIAPETEPPIPMALAATVPEPDIPLAVLEARRKQAELDAMLRPESVPQSPTASSAAPPTDWMPQRRPPSPILDTPRFLSMTEEQEVNVRAWLRKRVFWIVIAAVFGVNVLGREPGLVFPLWIFAIIFAVAFVKGKTRTR